MALLYDDLEEVVPVCVVLLRPHSTSQTSCKLVGNLSWQPGFPSSLQLVAN